MAFSYQEGGPGGRDVLVERMRLTDHRCQCAGCREYFNSTAAFDKHRTGHGAERRCRTPEEMRAIGMSQNPQGWWVTKLRPME